MRQTLINFLAFISFMLVCNSASAQTGEAGYDYLGIWRYVDIYVPKTGGADEVKCTIPIPPEGISDIQGPGAPSLTNDLGDTIDITFSAISQLRVELDMQDGDIDYELITKKYISGAPYYYSLIIQVHFVD